MSDGIPPYIPYRTFDNFLAELKARGVPSHVDRSVLSHKSGTIQSQLILALKYLGLVSDAGRSTEQLRNLAASEGLDRRRVLREVVESSYGFVFQGGFKLQSATTQHAEELFQATGASGETVRRCIAFFLAIARAAGIPVSPYIKPHRGKKALSRLREPRGETAKVSPRLSAPASERASKTIQLKSGGSLVLDLSVNLFDLNPADREFVFQIIDQFREYEEDAGKNR